MQDFVKQQQESASYDVWFKCQVKIGLDQANAGKLISHDDLEAKFDEKRKALLEKLTNKQ